MRDHTLLSTNTEKVCLATVKPRTHITLNHDFNWICFFRIRIYKALMSICIRRRSLMSVDTRKSYG